MALNSIRDVAVAVRGRRIDLGLSQEELARRAGVSRKWVYEFEGGKATAEFGLVLRVIEQLGFKLELRKDDDGAAGSVNLDDLLAQLEKSWSPPDPHG